jgi:hypothetical protein
VIHYALVCENAHKFEAWFRNAEAYDEQHRRGIVSCPICTSGVVEKALMAPAIGKAAGRVGDKVAPPEKVSFSAGHPQHAQLREALKALRNKVTSEADYVGDKFAEEARKIHFKDVEARGIYGEATPDEVSSLVEDGVDFMPLPNLPEEHN